MCAFTNNIVFNKYIKEKLVLRKLKKKKKCVFKQIRMTFVIFAAY